ERRRAKRDTNACDSVLVSKAIQLLGAEPADAIGDIPRAVLVDEAQLCRVVGGNSVGRYEELRLYRTSEGHGGCGWRARVDEDLGKLLNGRLLVTSHRHRGRIAA